MILDDTLRMYWGIFNGTIGLLIAGTIGLLGGIVITYFLTKTRKR